MKAAKVAVEAAVRTGETATARELWPRSGTGSAAGSGYGSPGSDGGGLASADRAQDEGLRRVEVGRTLGFF